MPRKPELLLSDIACRARLLELIASSAHADSRIRNLPAIALTAYARNDDRQRALLAGFQMHVSKPVEPRELIAGIASLLNLQKPG